MLHRAFRTVKSKRPMEEALPYHLLSMIVKDALRLNARFLLVAFDGPEVFRYKVDPNYKISRTTNKGAGGGDYMYEDADVYQYLPNVYELFAEVGIPFYQPKIFEADDVLNSLAFAYRKTHIFIGGTQDKDAYQWLSKYSYMFDSSFKNKDKKNIGRFIKVEDAEQRKGVTIEQMVDFQTLIGDDGDDVPPIGDIRAAKAKKILKEHGSILNWYKNASKDERIFIKARAARIKTNRQLVELRKDALPPGSIEDWILPKIKSKDKWLTTNFHDYHNFLYPKTRGLFGR
jgi:DNA polymerase-1